MYTIADVISPWFVLSLGAVAAAGLFFIIVLIEALVLCGLKWGSFRLSLVDSFTINLTSATIGVVLFVFAISNMEFQPGSGTLFPPFRGGDRTHRRRDTHPFEAASLAYNVDRGDVIDVVSYALLFVLVAGVMRL